jgi:hypothetical protein
MSVIINLLSKFDDSGIKKAQKGFGGLKKVIGAVSAALVMHELVDAAKAASADAKSQELLTAQLKRSAHATNAQVASNEAYIQTLSEQVGIVDDNLRPAMAKFSRVTKDVATAQRLLQITLDASAGSGLSQEKVAKAVAKAYTGNTKALQAMFPELKNSKDVLGDLAKEFQGFAEKKADPFAKFNVSMDNFKETVGTYVLPILEKLMKFFMMPYIKETALAIGILVVAMKAFAAISTAVEVALAIINSELIIMDGALTAMGWTLIVAAVLALIAGITYLATQTTFFQDTWSRLVSIFQASIKTFAVAWDLVKQGFMIAFEFIGKMFKGYVNGWLGLFEGFINFIVDGLNGVVVNLNNVLNGLKTATGGAISLSVPSVPKLKLPRLAHGGIVMPSPGGTNVTVGEGGKPEAIVPLNGRGGFGNTINIYVQSADPKAVVDALGKYLKQNGNIPKTLTNRMGR